MKKSPTPRRIETLLLLAAGCTAAFVYPLFGFGHFLKERYFATVDYAHQMSLLSWMYRVWFEGAGPFLSPNFFYPYKGILATSELPLLQGAIYAVIRWATAEPLLAWHVTFGLMVALSAAAMFAAVRYEGFSNEAAAVMALFYSFGAGLEALGDSINYRAMFGLPLAWLVLSRIRDERKINVWSYVLLLLVQLVQFAAGAVNTIAALLMICCRLLFEPALRRQRIWIGVGFVFAFVANLGMTWGQISGRYFSEMNVSKVIFIHSQNEYHVDLANFFLPTSLRGGFTPDPRWNWWGIARAWVPQMRWEMLALIALGIVFYMKRRFEAHRAPESERPAYTESDARVLRRWTLGALAAALGLLWLWIPSRPGSLDYPVGLLLRTSALLIAAGVFVYFRKNPAGTLLPGDLTIPYLLMALIPLSFSLGPIVFVFGKPFIAGPAAFADALAPGFERIRFLGRLWPASAVPLGMLAAGTFDRLFGKWRFARMLAAAFVLWRVNAIVIERYFQPPPDRALGIAQAACPDCGDDFRVRPLPYQWLQAHAPGEPLLELPMDVNNPPGKDEAPIYGHDVVYLTHYVFDGITRLNGITSWPPTDHLYFQDTMAVFPSPETLALIHGRGAKWLLIHGNRYPEEEWTRLQKQLDPPPEGFRLEKNWGPVWLFKVEQPLAPKGTMGHNE